LLQAKLLSSRQHFPREALQVADYASSMTVNCTGANTCMTALCLSCISTREGLMSYHFRKCIPRQVCFGAIRPFERTIALLQRRHMPLYLHWGLMWRIRHYGLYGANTLLRGSLSSMLLINCTGRQWTRWYHAPVRIDKHFQVKGRRTLME
jgi:hypothetical protein